MSKGEILANSKFYLKIDGLDDLLIKSVSGIGTTLEAAGDMKSFGVTKGGKSSMQATVTGISNATITVVFVATKDDTRLHDWYRASHSIGGPMGGGGSDNKGERKKSASVTVFNQGGEEAAVWTFQNVFPKSYKTSKMEPGTTELFTETVEFIYENMHRTK